LATHHPSAARNASGGGFLATHHPSAARNASGGARFGHPPPHHPPPSPVARRPSPIARHQLPSPPSLEHERGARFSHPLPLLPSAARNASPSPLRRSKRERGLFGHPPPLCCLKREQGGLFGHPPPLRCSKRERGGAFWPPTTPPLLETRAGGLALVTHHPTTPLCCPLPVTSCRPPVARTRAGDHFGHPPLRHPSPPPVAPAVLHHSKAKGGLFVLPTLLHCHHPLPENKHSCLFSGFLFLNLI
jgi:hypothetical protein